MNRNDKLQAFSGLPLLPPEMSNNEDLASFIFRLLIEQNAELIQEIRDLNHQKKIADEIVAELQQKVNALSVLAEEEGNRSAANIISEAAEKARVEASRILEEATRQAEATWAQKEKQATDRATSIIKEAETWARMDAEKILAEAERKAQEIVEEKTQFAIKQGLMIIDKAQAQAFSILDEARKQSGAITGKYNNKLKPR